MNTYYRFVLGGSTGVIMALTPLLVHADAANPSLFELIGKNPPASCVTEREMYPYGNSQYIECEQIPEKPSCSMSKSKYYQLIGQDKDHAMSYWCPTIRFADAQCETGEEPIICKESWDMDTGSTTAQCDGVGSFSLDTEDDNASYEKLTESMRFLIAEYYKFGESRKYCRRSATSATSTTTRQDAEEHPSLPLVPIVLIALVLVAAGVAMLLKLRTRV